MRERRNIRMAAPSSNAPALRASPAITQVRAHGDDDGIGVLNGHENPALAPRMVQPIWIESRTGAAARRPIGHDGSLRRPFTFQWPVIV